MKKAYVYAPNDLRLIEQAIPQPEPGQVLIKVRRASLCTSDVGRYQGDEHAGKPRGIGHDASGEVAAVGEGVSTLKEGDPVTLAGWMPCNQCHWCTAGHRERCVRRSTLPPAHAGWFADYTIVPEPNAIPLTPGVDYEDGALMESPYVGLSGHRVMGYGAGDFVPMFGGGWMAWGQLAAIKLAGATPVVIAGNPGRLAMSKHFGAVADFRAGDPDLAAKLMELNDGEAPVYVIDSTGGHDAGALPVIQQLAGYGARIGLLARKSDVPLVAFMRKHLQLVSIGPAWDKPAVVELIADGKLDMKLCVSHRFDFEDLQSAFDLLTGPDSGSVTKVMIDFPG